MSQEEDPSILDYARFYGLISDHIEPHPLRRIAARDTSHSLELDDDDDGLLPLNFPAFGLPQERLTVDAGAAVMLSSIAALAKVPPGRDNEVINTHRIKDLKLELPLLRSDHEVDMLNFGHQVLPDLEHEFLPLEAVNEEADEGLTWPSTCYQLLEKFANKSISEKLCVSSNALAYLQETLNFHLDDHDGFEYDDQAYRKRVKVEPVSPPLLPMSPIATPYIPSSDTGHLDPLSDHTSPTGDEAYEAERKVFENDNIILPKKTDINSPLSDATSLASDSLGDIYSPLKGIGDPPSSPPPLRAPLRDRKVEVPLSPLHLEHTPLSKKKRVSFSETIPDLISKLPPPIPKPENTSSSDIDAFFDEAIAPIGLKAERSIEQEQLQEEDTTLRVLVPVMDFSLPIAPWKANLQASMFDTEGKWYKNILAAMKALHFNKHIWPMSGKAERDLRWAPFPSALGRVENQERIIDDGSTTKYLEKPKRVNVNTLTWKPEGLRVLDELADSDDELEEGQLSEDTNFESLVRKRKLELDDVQSSLSGSDGGNDMPKATPSSKRHAAAIFPEEHSHSTTQVDGDTKITSGKRPSIDAFSTLGALDEFLGIRQGIVHKTKLLKAEHHFPTSSSTPSMNPLEQMPENDIPAPVSKRQSLASPDISSPTNPTPFVIAATLLSIRSLFRRIEHLFPSAVFIERDFSLHLPSPQRPQVKTSSNALSHPPSPKHTTPQLTNPAIAHEADLLLSPSTGLIHTTLQKIEQRSLPGHVSHSAIRERVLRTSPRYERLLILVSENRHDGESLLGNGDSTALIEFAAFCSNITGSDVHVTFVAGGEEELARWIVAMMIKYAVAEHEDVRLIQDETLWEIWLRRAGMNAFAAQAVLGKLKAGESYGGTDDWEKSDGVKQEWGLKAFVKMSARERHKRFEILLGGRRMLGRVGELVDGRW